MLCYFTYVFICLGFKALFRIFHRNQGGCSLCLEEAQTREKEKKKKNKIPPNKSRNFRNLIPEIIANHLNK